MNTEKQDDIIRIGEIIQDIISYIEDEKRYDFFRDYDGNLWLSLHYGCLEIHYEDDKNYIRYNFWDEYKEPEIHLILRYGFEKKLKEFAKSLAKYQDEIIKDIQKLNNK